MLTQSQKYGCGMYAVSNALNMPLFVTKARLEASKNGNRTELLSLWLQEDGIQLSIKPVYYFHNAKRIPKWFNEIELTGNDEVIAWPLLISCAFGPKSTQHHMIAGKLDKMGNLWIADSLQTKEYQTTFAEINDKYPIVYGVWAFVWMESGDYAYINL